MDVCPNPSCSNKNPVPKKWPNDFYYSYGKTPSGTKRYYCKLCGKTFASKTVGITYRQRLPEVNLPLFRILFSKHSIRDTSNILNVSAPTVYSKIKFFSKQFSLFANIIICRHGYHKTTCLATFPLEKGKFTVTLDLLSGFIFEFKCNEGKVPAWLVKDDLLERTEFSELKRFIKNAKKRIWAYDDFLKSQKGYKAGKTNLIFGIFKDYYNFCIQNHEKKTPAMILGLTETTIRVKYILEYT